MKAKKGFTLIELLIVIAIIGILAAALLPTILNAPARGRDAARMGHMNQIVAALEAYNSDNGKYPDATGCIDGTSVFTDAKPYFAGGNPPEDPSGPRGEGVDGVEGCVAAGQYYYNYVGTVDVGEYILSTVMEIEGNNNTDDDPDTFDNTSVTGPTYGGSTYYVLVK